MRPIISVLVIREDDIFSETLRAADVGVTNLPLIRTEAIDNQSDLFRTIENINKYDGLFFTSPSAAEIFTKEFKNAGPFHGKIYAMGLRSKEVLERLGSNVEFDPAVSSAAELVSFYGDELHGKSFLFVRGDRSMQTIPNMLKSRSRVDEVVVYRTVHVQPSETEIKTVKKHLDGGEFRWISFFSPSAIDAFLGLFGDRVVASVAAIGSTTARRAADQGMNVEFVSPRSTAADFAKSFLSHLNGTQS